MQSSATAAAAYSSCPSIVSYTLSSAPWQARAGGREGGREGYLPPSVSPAAILGRRNSQEKTAAGQKDPEVLVHVYVRMYIHVTS